MNGNTLRTTALPSLLEGTSRHPLPEAPLAMLSLMGQALRFERPPTPDSFSVDPEIQDDREIIPDRLRRPLIRLLTTKNLSDHPARALARAFDRLRLRPHPFDLPSIDAFVRAHAEKLGPTAQHWAGRQKPDAAKQSYFDPELLDESNWAQASLSRRVAYLEKRRQHDADTARTLVESTWAHEEADARFRLLQAFQTRLSMADQPFLSSLEKDRAPRVRALAGRFLARLGASSKNPALEACLERIKLGQSGLLRKRATLQLELPANVKDQAAQRWILQTFSDISFAELARAFKLEEEDLIEAAEKNDDLLLALAVLATNEHRLDLLERVVANLPNTWERLFGAGLDALGAMTVSERQRWQEVISLPYRKDPPENYFLWDWLHRITDVEASPALMSIALGALPKGSEIEQAAVMWFELIAAICPRSKRRELHDRLAQFEPSQTVATLTLLEILEGMENVHAHV
jgi:hypothetical protein